MAQDTAADGSSRDQISERIAEAAGLAGAATLTSRLLGLAREQVLAALFGASDEMDAYLVAFRIPNLVRDLFAEGAMSAAFVPTFTRHLTLHGKSGAWRLANNVLTALLLITGFIVIVGSIFAVPLVTAYAQNFAAVPGKLELTIFLARVMFPFLILVALAVAVMGMLNSLRHYFVPALAPATFNIVAIVFAFGLTPLMPFFGYPRIMSMALATLVGGLVQLIVQMPALWREGFRYRPLLDPSDPRLRRVLVLMGPGTVGVAATQLNLFVTTLFATSQGTGAVSWLQYAFRVMYLPLGLFGVSIATAVLPAAARQAATDNREALRSTVSRGLSLMLMVNIPAACGLAILSHDIVRLLFERGHFTPHDTDATAAALRIYALGLVGYSTARIVSPVFYTLGRSRVPVMLSVISVSVNVALSIVLIRSMGFVGLAMATSMAALTNATLCLFLLRAQLGGIGGRRLAASFGKVTLASLTMSAVVLAVNRSLAASIPGGSAVSQAAALAVTITVGVAALVAAARLLKIEEFATLGAQVSSRVQKLLAR
jgi:putative peptidoglycan lipid II flippase